MGKVMKKEIDLDEELDLLVDAVSKGVEKGEINIGIGLIATTLAHVACELHEVISKLDDTNELLSDILETKDGCTSTEE